MIANGVSNPQTDSAQLYSGYADSGRAWVFAGNELCLSADPKAVASGSNLTLTMREGVPANPALLVATSINGSPTFAIAGMSFFE